MHIEMKKGNTHRTAWVPHEKGVKPGNLIRLKGEEDYWRIMSVSKEVDGKLLHTDWNNNI